MTQVFVCAMPDGRVAICHPAPWHRLCKAVTINGERRVLERPVHFDELVRVCKTDALSPEWAETEDAFMQRIRKRIVPADAVSVRVADKADIPPDRSFREALKPDLTHDMAKARSIHKDRMRAARAPKLAALDVAYQRADEAGDTAAKTDIARQKKALRDVTADPGLAAAKTTAELQRVWPAVLGVPQP